MKLSICGLGRMGFAIAKRAQLAGHEVVGYDLSAQAQQHAQDLGIPIVHSIEELIAFKGIIWLMIPQGKPVDDLIAQLLPHVKPGTIIVDGGNSHFTDTQRRSAQLKEKNIYFIDCGTSGGLQGESIGFCLMVGGDRAAFALIEPLLEAIASPKGYAYIGNSGAGHYVKMIHNGIEYGLLQAYAEGFQLIKEGSFAADQINLEQLSNLWDTSAVIRSWILQLAEQVFSKDQQFNTISGCIDQGGTGQWSVDEAKKHNISVPVIKNALQVREWSCKTGGNYATKLVALLRNKFGGHKVHLKGVK